MPWRRYKTEPLVWLRKDVFDAVLPLRASNLNTSLSTDGEITPPPPPTPLDAARQVGAMASALRKEDPFRTQYTTWVTEAWRLLQWSEPTAKLFWEMLCMTHTGDMNVVEELPVAHACLFLLLHLHPDSVLHKVKFLKTVLIETRFTPEDAMIPHTRADHLRALSGVAKTRQPPLSHFSGTGPCSRGNENAVASSPSSPSLKRIARLASRGFDDAHRLRFVRAHLWNIIRLLSRKPAICGSVAHSISTSIDIEQPEEDFVLSMDEIAGISYLVTCEMPTGNSLVKESPPAGWLTAGIFDAIVLTAERAGQSTSSIPAPWLHNILYNLLTVNEDVYHIPSPPKTLSNTQSIGPTLPSTMSWACMCAEASPLPPMLNNMKRTTVIRFMDESDEEMARLPLMDLFVNYCSKSYIYILAPVKHATIFGCSDCTIVIGAAAGLVRVVDCEHVQLVSAARRLLVNNCIECIFPCFAAYAPILFGDNRSCMFAPHNALYPRITAHMRIAGLPGSSPAINNWCHPVEAVSAGAMHHSGPRVLTDSGSLSQLLLPPELFFMLSVPYWNMERGRNMSQDEHEYAAPLSLPQRYSDALENREEHVATLLENLRNIGDEDVSAKEVVHTYYKEWLFHSRNVRQILDLVAM
eukprot:13690_1